MATATITNNNKDLEQMTAGVEPILRVAGLGRVGSCRFMGHLALSLDDIRLNLMGRPGD